MKIVHFSTSDSEGGSARSARRIHESLRRLGHTSHMLVGTKASHDSDVDTTHGGGGGRMLDRLAEESTKRLGLQYLWYPSERRILSHRWIRDASVIQLYNTHGGYLSHRLLPALARIAPVVWRLSDMWAMTGHCAYAGPCGRWEQGCGNCPDLATYPPLPFDTTRLLWRIKHRTYHTARPVIVAPSRWMEDLAKRSPLFAECRVQHIATGVDETIYRPIDKQAARAVLGLPPDGELILFTAHSVDDDQRKGSAAAIAALARITARPGRAVMLLGVGGAGWQAKIPHPVIRLGFLRDERLVAAAYAAADLAIAPSVVENLPNSILEAMACGTPAVAFDAGGIGDAVRHLKTGWLSPPGDIAHFAHGIEHLLDSKVERARLSRGALEHIRRNFSAEREAREFLALYGSLGVRQTRMSS